MYTEKRYKYFFKFIHNKHFFSCLTVDFTKSFKIINYIYIIVNQIFKFFCKLLGKIITLAPKIQCIQSV